MATRKYILGNSSQLARALGVSKRQAQRIVRARPGAVKHKGRWEVPLTADEFSRAEGISLPAARKRGIALNPADLRDRPGKVGGVLRTVYLETDLDGDGHIPASHYLPTTGIPTRYAYSWRAVIEFLDSKGDFQVVQGNRLLSDSKQTKQALRAETDKELRSILGPGERYHGRPFRIVSVTVVAWKRVL